MSAIPPDEEKIAVIFDFDDTIAPDSTTKLLEQYDVSLETFWEDRFLTRVKNGYDPSIAYLSLLVEYTDQGKALEGLTMDDLNGVGSPIEVFDGLEGLMSDLNEIASGYEGVSVESYIISEGLQSIIEGTDVADEFEAIYGSELADEEGEVTGIKRAISFTDKTRYLFEINKGIPQEDTMKNPYLVNKKKEDVERDIPFENMIYIGDGITDIPCFSLIKEKGGRAFGVYAEEMASPKQEVIKELGSPHRTQGSLNEPNYEDDKQLGSLLRLTIEGMCADRTIDGMEVI